jgi:hypothetical protein
MQFHQQLDVSSLQFLACFNQAYSEQGKIPSMSDEDYVCVELRNSRKIFMEYEDKRYDLGGTRCFLSLGPAINFRMAG